eukprot:8602028-Pyramimonas_sp.AAC.1
MHRPKRHQQAPERCPRGPQKQRAATTRYPRGRRCGASVFCEAMMQRVHCIHLLNNPTSPLG